MGRITHSAPEPSTVSTGSKFQPAYEHLDVIDELISNREAYIIGDDSRASISVSAFPHFLTTCIHRVNAHVALRMAKSHQAVEGGKGQRLIITTPEGHRYRVAKPRGRQGAYLTCEPGTQAVMRACIVSGINEILANEQVQALVRFQQDFYLADSVSSLFQNEISLILNNWMVGIPDPKMSGVGRQNVWVDQDLNVQVSQLSKRLGLKKNVFSCLCVAYALEGLQDVLGDYCNDLRMVTGVFDMKVRVRLAVAKELEDLMELGTRKNRGKVKGRVKRQGSRR